MFNPFFIILAEVGSPLANKRTSSAKAKVEILECLQS